MITFYNEEDEEKYKAVRVEIERHDFCGDIKLTVEFMQKSYHFDDCVVNSLFTDLGVTDEMQEHWDRGYDIAFSCIAIDTLWDAIDAWGEEV